MPLPTPPPSYSQAMDQLREIVAELEGGSLDIDQMLDRVRQAEELVAYCRARLQDASGSLEDVVARMKGRDATR